MLNTDHRYYNNTFLIAHVTLCIFMLALTPYHPGGKANIVASPPGPLPEQFSVFQRVTLRKDGRGGGRMQGQCLDQVLL